jgi:hypothetical protein
MEHGKILDNAILPDLNEAKFPDEPWPRQVNIIVKRGLHATVHTPQGDADSGGLPPDSDPPAPANSPAPPGTWQNATPGPSLDGDTDASQLWDHQSTNTLVETQMPPDPEEIAQLEKHRGLAGADQAVCKVIGWATRKDYEIHVGVSLEIPDAIRDASHGIQHWEIASFFRQIGSSRYLHIWLREQLRNRSPAGVLAQGMPETNEWTEVPVSRRSNGDMLGIFVCTNRVKNPRPGSSQATAHSGAYSRRISALVRSDRYVGHL